MEFRVSDNWAAPCLLVAAMLILILFQSVFFADAGIAGPEEGGGDGAEYIGLNGVKYRPDRFFMLAVASNVCAFLFTGAFFVKFRGLRAKDLKLGLPKLKYLPLLLYMLLFLVAGTVLVNALLVCFGWADGVGRVMPFLFQTGGNTAYEMGVLISFVVLPAVCEEFFFRSAVAAGYERHGAFCACVFTAAAFSLSHFSPKFFPSYFFAAVVFYITAKVTDSVFFSMLLHAVYNFFCIYLGDKALGALHFEQNWAMFIFVAAIIFLVSVFFVLNALEGIYSKKAYLNEPSPESIPEGGIRGAAAGFLKSLGSPAFIAAVIIFIIYV